MKENKEEQQPLMFTHKELAGIYFPDRQLKTASTQLTRWIRRDPELMEELKNAGYTGRQRIYSPLQTTILLKHLGEPKKGMLS